MAVTFWSELGNKLRGKLPSNDKYLVTRVIDGDTFNISVNGIIRACRLSGIDAPELKQQGGVKAKLWLIDKIHGRYVFIHFLKAGKYKRLICHVVIEGELLQIKMLESGLVFMYYKYVEPGLKRTFTVAENYAIINRLGVHGIPDMDVPWEFRHLNL